MIFGDLPLERAEGAILAHSVKLAGKTFKKGRVLSAADIAALRVAGIARVAAARLEPDEVGEDAAANRLAQSACGQHLTRSAAFTGRSNLFAETAGVLVLDRARIDRFNLVDEAITIATLAPYDMVEPHQMVATIKIIPFAAPTRAVEACAAIAGEGGPLLRIAPFQARAAGLVQTRLAGMKESVLDSTAEATRARLEALGSQLQREIRCDHDAGAVAHAIVELRAEGCAPILLFGASAVTDRRDVLPAAIAAAGGTVEHFGMPVDPGNLLLIGRLSDTTEIIGMPGCSRSPKLNGLDWVLQRLLAGIAVTRRDIMLMGTGGLLKEIPSRPLPRAEAGRAGAGRAGAAALKPRAPRIAVMILAAGKSSRMGSANKLLAELDGQPMVAWAVQTALASKAAAPIVVTGHMAVEVERAVRDAAGDRPVRIVHNPDYAAGLSASLAAGVAALGDEADGVIVCLGDMPRVGSAVLDRLIAAFDPVEGRAICVPTYRGKRGNPVLWDKRFFPELRAIAGDVGARHLIGAHGELVADVEMADDGVLVDVDTPQALATLKSAAREA
ncbi:MAG: 4-diphosphocytidyl-2C-methyl-D-erythritol kinase [Alphaproteobacteria bacterium]|nr:4-diphosphocytidyl-2C-methyl-D-erythritol kinase [Alphaproteobacteria bacterium]